MFAANNYIIVGEEIPVAGAEGDEGGAGSAGALEPLVFVAYTYAGCLPGWGPFFTNRGIACSLDFVQVAC